MTALVAGVRNALADVERMLAAIDPSVYTNGKLDPCFASTIGAHVRHVAEHARALVHAAETGVADYEHRERGGEIETCKVAATAELRSISEQLGAINCVDGTTSVRVSVIACAGQPARMVLSTFEREAAFVMSHTIHHIAIMRQIVARAGLDQVTGIGLAPGTPRTVAEASAAGGGGAELNACAH